VMFVLLLLKSDHATHANGAINIKQIMRALMEKLTLPMSLAPGAQMAINGVLVWFVCVVCGFAIAIRLKN
jgi:hypothetical protein